MPSLKNPKDNHWKRYYWRPCCCRQSTVVVSGCGFFLFLTFMLLLASLALHVSLLLMTFLLLQASFLLLTCSRCKRLALQRTWCCLHPFCCCCSGCFPIGVILTSAGILAALLYSILDAVSAADVYPRNDVFTGA